MQDVGICRNETNKRQSFEKDVVNRNLICSTKIPFAHVGTEMTINRHFDQS